MINLSKRLSALASYVKDNSKLLDVGCDHALLDIYLYQTRKNIKIIASDVNEKALEQAKKNVKKYNLEKNIDLRLGNGLNVVEKEEIDTIVMSGLGSHKMVGILYNNLSKLKNVDVIITGTQSNDEFLREKVIAIGYYILDEVLIKENDIIYIIIVFAKGKKKYSKKELFFGPIILKKNDALFQEKIKKDYGKLKTLEKIIPKSHFLHLLKIKRKIKLYNKIIK